VSTQALERALAFANAIILCLEAEGFEVTVLQTKHSTGVKIFGHRVPFLIVEKLREKSRREVKDYSRTRKIIEYEPKGELEFRVGDYACGRKIRDGKKRLEEQLSICVGALLREGRDSLISANLAEQRNLERQAKERERSELAQQIAEEEKKVNDLEGCVSSWTHARQMREFIEKLSCVYSLHSD